MDVNSIPILTQLQKNGSNVCGCNGHAGYARTRRYLQILMCQILLAALVTLGTEHTTPPSALLPLRVLPREPNPRCSCFCEFKAGLHKRRGPIQVSKKFLGTLRIGGAAMCACLRPPSLSLRSNPPVPPVGMMSSGAPVLWSCVGLAGFWPRPLSPGPV